MSETLTTTRKRAEKERKEPEGLKLYIGNLPFSATQDHLKELVGAHATVNEVILATGPGGKAKGFGFVFIAEKDKGEAVVAAINNTELEGRKIKVDIAKAKGGKGGGRGGNRGGDGDRWKIRPRTQALREEGKAARSASDAPARRRIEGGTPAP